MEFQSLDETIKLLKILSTIDVASTSLEELLQLYSTLSNHVAVITTIPAGTVVCRSVSCKHIEGRGSGIPNKVSQISFNPNAAACSFNRASWEGTTAFYGSVSTEKLRSYYTCGFEILNDLKESGKEKDRETFVTGKWIVKKNLEVVQVSGNLKHNLEQVTQRAEAFKQIVSQYPDYEIQLELIDNFLTKEFSKAVSKDNKLDYKLSASYAEIIRRDNWPGILFPSVQADGAGYNIALFPDHVDEYLELERAALTTYYRRSSSIVNEYSMVALPDGDNLRWAELFNEKFPPAAINWYTGRSDDDSFNKYIQFEDL